MLRIFEDFLLLTYYIIIIFVYWSSRWQTASSTGVWYKT